MSPRRYIFHRHLFQGSYFIVACLSPKDDSCQSLKNGVKFCKCCLLHASWWIFQGKWSSFWSYTDTVVVVFSERSVQLLISHNAHLQRVVCSNISHALWWLHHLLWNRPSVLWPLLGVFAEEDGEADQVSWLRLCLWSVAEPGATLKTCLCPALHIHLLHCLCLSVALTRKSWWRQYCFKHFMRSAHFITQL